MNSILQQIYLGDNNSLYLIDFDINTNELSFRTTRNPNYLQKEVIKIDKDNVYTNLYFFNIGYLQKFIQENNLIQNDSN